MKTLVKFTIVFAFLFAGISVAFSQPIKKTQFGVYKRGYVSKSLKENGAFINTGFGVLEKSRSFKAVIPDTVDAAADSAWTNFTGFTAESNETTSGYISIVGSNSLVCGTTGIYQFGGTVHVRNNTATNFGAYKILSRLLKVTSTSAEINGSKAEFCTDSLYAATGLTLNFAGIEYLESGDTVRLQYYTSTDSTDFNNNVLFGDSIAVSISMNYLGIQ